MADRGRAFQEDFAKSCIDQQVMVERIPDPLGGYKSIANFADYYVYQFPYLYYFELKSRKGKYFQIGGKNPDFTPKQYDGLLEKSKQTGIHAGFLVEFADYEEHYYFPIQAIEEYINRGVISIKQEEASNYGTLVVSHKRRTRFSINVNQLLRSIRAWGYWK